MLIEFPVFLRGTPQQAGFLFIKHFSRQCKPVGLIFPHLLNVEGALRHRHILSVQVLL
jgi:hypothetical protein